MVQSLFDKYQKEILHFINSEAGRFLLSIKDNYPVIKISPNSYHQLIDIYKNKSVIKANFYGSARIENIFLPIIEKIKIAKKYVQNKDDAFLHYSGFWLKNNKYPQIYLVTSTFTPQTGEGEIKGPTNAASWATERSGSGVAQANPIIVYGALTGGVNYNLNRVFEPFDTSSIGAATINSSFIKMYRDDSIDTFSNVDTTTYEVVKSQQASATALVNGDYNSFTNTSIGSTALSATTNGAYTNTTITDQTAINPTGSTKLAIIIGRDLNNSAPTGINECCFQNRGNANPPTLSVTYTPTAITNLSHQFYFM